MRCMADGCTDAAIDGRRHCDAHVMRCRDCLCPALVRNLCERCYLVRVATRRLPRARLCREDGCGRPSRARGMCATHYKRWRRTPEPDRVPAPRYRAPHPCSAPGCERMSRLHDLCEMHYQQARRGAR